MKYSPNSCTLYQKEIYQETEKKQNSCISTAFLSDNLAKNIRSLIRLRCKILKQKRNTALILPTFKHETHILLNEHNEPELLQNVPQEQDLVSNPALGSPVWQVVQGQASLLDYQQPPAVLQLVEMLQGDFWKKEIGTLEHPQQTEVNWSTMNQASRTA